MPACLFTPGQAVVAQLALLGALAVASPCAPSQQEPDKYPAKSAPPPASEYRPLNLVVSTEQAIRTLETKIKNDPKDVLSHVLLGHTYLRKAREQGDFASYQKAEAVVQRA